MEGGFGISSPSWMHFLSKIFKTVALASVSFKTWCNWLTNSSFGIQPPFFTRRFSCCRIERVCKDPGPCETYSKAMTAPTTTTSLTIAWFSLWQQDCFLNSWISSNSCGMLLPAEISAGKWDFVLTTNLSIPLQLHVSVQALSGERKRKWATAPNILGQNVFLICILCTLSGYKITCIYQLSSLFPWFLVHCI